MWIPSFIVIWIIFQVEFLMGYHVWNHRLNPFEAQGSRQSNEMNCPVSSLHISTLTYCTLSKGVLIHRKDTMEHFLGEFKKQSFQWCSICKIPFMIKDSFGENNYFFRISWNSRSFFSSYKKFHFKCILKKKHFVFPISLLHEVFSSLSLVVFSLSSPHPIKIYDIVLSIKNCSPFLGILSLLLQTKKIQKIALVWVTKLKIIIDILDFPLGRMISEWLLKSKIDIFFSYICPKF